MQNGVHRAGLLVLVALGLFTSSPGHAEGDLRSVLRGNSSADGETRAQAAAVEGVVDANPVLRVRSYPWGPVIGGFARGDKVRILGISGDFYRIAYEGGVAYVHRTFVTTPSAPSRTYPIKYPPGCENGGFLPPSDPGAGENSGNADGNDSSTRPPQKPADSSPPSGAPITVGKFTGKGFESNGRLDVPERAQRDPANGRLGSSFCGPTSLAMALQYWGINKPTKKVAVQCHTISPSGKWQGSSCENLLAAARECGLKGSVLKEGASIAWLKKTVESGVPVIVNVDTSWSKGHYMVCTGVKNGRVYLNDPWVGHERSYSISAFQSQWAGRNNRCVAVKP